MEFERIVVFGDFHGDLDTMLASLSDKGLVRYDSSGLEGIIEQIKAGLNESFVPSLEALVIPAAQPIRVVFLGDFLDRYHFGYHMIQFLDKIRWENFGIYPIFLISNHDLLNFHFFINPFEMQELYQGCGHSRSDTLSYVNGMGIDKSLESFKALHRALCGINIHAISLLSPNFAAVTTTLFTTRSLLPNWGWSWKNAWKPRLSSGRVNWPAICSICLEK